MNVRGNAHTHTFTLIVYRRINLFVFKSFFLILHRVYIIILENVCLRPWAFERIPNKMIRGLDNALIYTSTKEACLAACLNEHRFTCRSVEYNYVTLQCHLGDSDRRTTGQYVQFVDAQGVDYFENLCLKGK